MAALAMVTLSSAVPRSAWCELAIDPAPRPVPSKIVIVLAGGIAVETATLADMLRRSLGPPALAIDVNHVVTMDPRQVVESGNIGLAVVTVWIDLAVPNLATLYITDGDRVFTRHFGLKQSLDAIALDLLDYVVTSAVDAMLAGKQIGVAREDFKKSLGAKTKSIEGEGNRDTRPQSPPATWLLSGLYEAELMTSQRAVQTPGLLLEVRRSKLQLGLCVLARIPFDVSDGGTTVRLTGVGLRVLAGRIFPLGSGPWALVMAGALGADLTLAQTVVAGGNLISTGDTWAIEPIVRSTARLQWGYERFTVGAEVAVDAALVGARYVIDGSSASRPVWSPWRWRPSVGLLLGLAL